MRIAMVSEHASPLAVTGGVDAGGQNVHVAALAAALVRRGHHVRVFTRRDDPDLPDTLQTSDGYVVEHVPAGPASVIAKDDMVPFMPQFGEYLLQRLTDEPADVLHAHFWMSGIAGMTPQQVLGVPLVMTFHALGVVKRRHQGTKDTSPMQRIATEAVLCTSADRVIATCMDEVSELRRMGLSAPRTSVVPCGVDTDHFTAEGATIPRGNTLHRLLVVSRLVERKGIEDVVRALPMLTSAELVVAGGPPVDEVTDDPEARRLLDIARGLGVADRTTFVGRVPHDEMPALFRSADVVVATPWYEPFGIVPLEAMACGKPVVASAVGGLTDTVVDGLTGLLVQPRQPADLARSLSVLLLDPELRARLGANGLQRARANYTWDLVAARTESAYLRTIDRHSRHIPAADRPRMRAQ